MIKFIVFDKVQGFSWINDNLDEVKESMGYTAEDSWNNILEEVKEVYELITVNGDFEIGYLLD